MMKSNNNSNMLLLVLLSLSLLNLAGCFVPWHQQTNHKLAKATSTTTTTTTNIVEGNSNKNGAGKTRTRTRTRTAIANSKNPLEDTIVTDEESDAAIQWELFNRHHAKGSWKGIWTTYDVIGDIIDETVGSVDLNVKQEDENNEMIEQTHTIVVGAKRSDCTTCFDSMEQKTLPVATYTPTNLQKSRFASISMVNGPSILRSGAMATELVLKHGDGRIRAIFQHAPVWERNVEPGSCPPQGLKIFRVMLSKEALRSTAPTAETEALQPPTDNNPTFYRPVPPFNWHKKWSGTSWTWGPTTGNRGWSIEEMEETDAWHGITPVETWNLRLPGGIFLQAPRIITDTTAGICRIAWLPNDETLLRVEAGVQALQPMIVEDDMMVGFEPPSLVSLRCDVMSKVGELENVPRPSRDWDKSETDDDSNDADAPSSSVTDNDEKDTKTIIAEAMKASVSAADGVNESEPTKTTSSATAKKDNNMDDEPPSARDVISL